ncbi:MAG: hypothetical protein KA297_15130 [Kofleriaceae bacterium]|nr:hypothetical protein [Kofleriaceae bacterium]MBP6841520.1 hypothetical protein [Kofleriaceae bacterium]
MTQPARLVLASILLAALTSPTRADTGPSGPNLAVVEPTAPGMVAPVGAQAGAGPIELDAAITGGDPPTITYMATAAIGTTVAYRPPQGTFAGPQRDVGVGVGVVTTPSTSVNLDLAVTFGEDGYLSTAIGATGSLTVHPNFYVVMHTLVSVDPTVDFYLQPGAGVTHSIGATAPFVEVTAASAVGRGALDVGIGVAVGASRNF